VSNTGKHIYAIIVLLIGIAIPFVSFRFLVPKDPVLGTIAVFFTPLGVLTLFFSALCLIAFVYIELSIVKRR